MTPAARCGSPPESAASDCLFAASSRTARPETRRFRQRAGRAGRAPRQYDKTPVASPHLVGGAENGTWFLAAQSHTRRAQHDGKALAFISIKRLTDRAQH